MGEAEYWFDNTPCLTMVNAFASWLNGIPNTNSGTNAILYPQWVSLGNGSGTPAYTDTNMFAEVYGTRILTSGTVIAAPSGLDMVGNCIELTTQYTASQPNGTFTEAGFWDSAPAQLSMGASSSGATSITVSANSLPWRADEQIYIADSTNPEYVTVSSSPPSQGSTVIPLAAATLYAHAASTPVFVFSGNLWAHSAFATSVTKAANYLMTVTWYIGSST